ncbi:MAG TPA: hypothetical protein VHM19_09190, partial [Polyangiales bacterium]|nr:hypothetical protein [Polyangiales bacterium]
LRSCSADPDQSVSRACSDALAPAGAQPAASTSELDLYAYSPDGNTPLVDTLVALRLPGGAVFVGNTDANAHLRLRSVPSGELRLEDPAQAPLDP